jgi:uncharacterized oxidoreductase
MKITGGTVLITGGAAGIGRALAQAFRRSGNRVLVADKDRARLAALQARWPDLAAYPCDLCQQEQLVELAEAVRRAHPELNVLVNNAGVHYNYRFTDAGELLERIDREIATNLTAMVKLSALLLPHLRRQPRAAIVNVSSGLAFAAKKNAAVYCATKAAIHQFTRVLRYQLEATSVQVFELLPPLVDTEMTRGRGERKMSPEELAARFLRELSRDRREIDVGDVSRLRWLHRIRPELADRTIEED